MSETPRQEQRAGGHSQQNQAARDVIAGDATTINATTANIYMTQTRPAVIAREYSSDAIEEATRRLTAFDDAFVRRLDALERLSALAEPGYQKTLSSARVAAAGSDRPVDSERLVELMAERAADPDRLIRATVARAVQIIDDVEEERLRQLVWYYGGSTHIRGAATARLLMGQWEERLRSIGFSGEAPPSGWLEHLHVIGAVRLDSSGAQTLRSITDWMTGTDLPFFMPGLPVEVQAEKFAAYSALGVRLAPYVVHELRPDHLRLLSKKKSDLMQMITNLNPTVDSSEQVADLLVSDFQPELQDNTAIAAFRQMLAEHELLARYDAWRLAMINPVYITQVGIALVWAYLRQQGYVIESLGTLLVDEH